MFVEYSTILIRGIFHNSFHLLHEMTLPGAFNLYEAQNIMLFKFVIQPRPNRLLQEKTLRILNILISRSYIRLSVWGLNFYYEHPKRRALAYMILKNS